MKKSQNKVNQLGQSNKNDIEIPLSSTVIPLQPAMLLYVNHIQF